jgi:hypothetical protein
MEIVYDSPIYGVLHVGARLPWKGETLENIVLMYNPTRYWLEQTMETASVEVNSQGTQQIDVPDLTELVPPKNIILSEEQLVQIARSNRQYAYQTEADPIFFKSQRGEATEQDWLEKVAEIKARYPLDGSALDSTGMIPVGEV